MRLKGEIDSLQKSVDSCHSLLNDADKQILSAMNDVVGQSASESIKSIRSTFDHNFDKSIKASKNAINEMIKGYDIIKSIVDRAEHLFRQAEQIKADLGTV